MYILKNFSIRPYIWVSVGSDRRCQRTDRRADGRLYGRTNGQICKGLISRLKPILAGQSDQVSLLDEGRRQHRPHRGRPPDWRRRQGRQGHVSGTAINICIFISHLQSMMQLLCILNVFVHVFIIHICTYIAIFFLNSYDYRQINVR